MRSVHEEVVSLSHVSETYFRLFSCAMGHTRSDLANFSLFSDLCYSLILLFILSLIILYRWWIGVLSVPFSFVWRRSAWETVSGIYYGACILFCRR